MQALLGKQSSQCQHHCVVSDLLPWQQCKGQPRVWSKDEPQCLLLMDTLPLPTSAIPISFGNLGNYTQIMLS